jgi:hypothetical protein
MTERNESEEQADVIQILQGIAGELCTKSVSSKTFYRRSGIGRYQVRRLFGSYSGLVEAAGLLPRRFAEARKYSDQELLAEIARVLRIPNSKLSISFFEQHSQMSAWTCVSRFGTWFKALKATARQLDPQRDGALVSRIRAIGPSESNNGDRPAADSTLSLPQAAPAQSLETRAKESPVEEADVPVEDNDVACDRTEVYGDLICFRSLEHAPLNEQGVVFLFGMICRDLGYVVEKLTGGFPDCEAKRRVRPGIWQRVRIKFEFQSRTFRTQGHDPYQCDVIVCWENNWPDCPIEVQELKSMLPQLPRWR